MSTSIHTPGVVYLVGAGPGDPGLITLRGAELLQSADVVVYDYLSNPALLKHCPTAKAVYVGKKAAAHSFSQEQINSLLIQLAHEHRRVVRLKGGDPFVFGRGGEECEALAAAGIRFEVVPGITAAIAAPAYAGIPVTHRDLNSSFTLVTGHEKEEEYQDAAARQRGGGAASDLDWQALAKLPCLAFYMGVKALPRICQRLIEHGMPADTPVAVIRWGTRPDQQTIAGTLTDIGQRVTAAKLAPPAMTIVGQVVKLRQTISWFETRPLFGQTFVVTRTRHQASALSNQLAELGARVIEAPTIELAEPDDWQPIDAALHTMAAFDWIIFTSGNGVEAVRRRLKQIGLDARAFGQAKIAAIGAATADAIARELCLNVDLCPPKFVAEALADALEQRGEVAGKRFLLLRADIARPLLRQRLEKSAATVLDLPIYRTRPAAALPDELLEALAAGEVNWITFTSSSTAANFFALLPESLRGPVAQAQRASIGPITSDTLRQLGFPPTVQAETYDIAGLVQSCTRPSADQ